MIELIRFDFYAEDNSKDKRKARLREKGEYAITSDVLVEIMEESIRIFWQFVRADKDCTNLIAKGKTGKSRELQDPADSTLFLEVQKNLIKVRSYNFMHKTFSLFRTNLVFITFLYSYLNSINFIFSFNHIVHLLFVFSSFYSFLKFKTIILRENFKHR